MFANDDGLAAQLDAAGRAVGEKLWRMPLGDAYDRLIDSTVADVKNISGAREAGSIVGAQFLKRFVATPNGRISTSPAWPGQARPRDRAEGRHRLRRSACSTASSRINFET